MSALADWLDDKLAPEDAPEGPDEQWRVTDEASADWAARKIQRYARERDAKQAEYDRIVDAATAWLQTETAELDRQIGFFESKLGAWLKQLIEEDPDGKKSRRLPCGATVKRTGGNKSLTVQDERALVDWLKDNHPELVESEVVFKWSKTDVKKTFTVPDDGGPLVTEDGEKVPGAAIEVGPYNFTVTP